MNRDNRTDPPLESVESFVREVGERYLRLRGNGLTLSSLDVERIQSWHARGVPLRLALEAIDRAHSSFRGGGRARKSRPFPLSRAEKEIEAAMPAVVRKLSSSQEGTRSSPSTGTPDGGYGAPVAMNEFLRPLSLPLKELLDEIHQRVEREGLAPAQRSVPSGCEVCRGAGYTIAAEGSFAVATACDCERICERCGGRGFLVEEDGGYEFSRRCACQTLPQRIAAFNAAQLPARFSHKTFDNFYVRETDPRSVLDAKTSLENFAKGVAAEKLGFGLIGGPGRGKTHLLAATLATLSLERGISCRYVEISFLFADLKAAISDPRARATVDKIDELAEVDVLAVDELGKGRGSVFEEEVLDELIGRRYNNEKLTLFATNYPLEDQPDDPLGQSLKSRVGERIFSRLHEMVVFLALPKGVDDHRLLLRKMMR